MNDSAENFENLLGLIDVSLEDDSLYAISSPPCHFHFSDDLLDNGNPLSLNIPDSQSLPTSVAGADVREDALPPLGSSEPAETKPKNVKYNLRTSLAWDSAFLTGADDLSSMAGHTEKRGMLPEIREELERWTDSFSSLASEGGNVDGDMLLFGDIRAPIQKSNRSFSVANSKPKSSARMGSGLTPSRLKLSPKTMEEASPVKTKARAGLKKAALDIPGSRRTLKQASPTVQVPQSLAKEKELASLSKPHKIAGRVSISTVAKGASLNNNRVKLGNDNGKGSASVNAKELTGTLKLATSGGPRNSMSRLLPPLRASSSSTKTESIASSTSNCSKSISSDSTIKLSLKSVGQKVDARAGVPSLSLIAKATSRITSESINQSRIPRLSPYLKSAPKLSPNVSPASSVSEWSSESFSLSPTSTLNKRSNCSRSSVYTSSYGDCYEDDCSSRFLDSQSHCSKINEARIHVASMKRVSKESFGLRADPARPSGLRLPSPKIGFFDGGKSSARNLNGNVHSQPGAPSRLPRPRSVVLGKLQTAKAATGSRVLRLTLINKP